MIILHSFAVDVWCVCLTNVLIIRKKMRAFWIFAICLTVAYIIYYAVTIVRDLYGKPGEKKSDEETFEVASSDDEQEEASISVAESETGFSIGDETFETSIAPDESADGEESEADREKNSEAAFAKRKAQAESEMEDTQPCFSDSYDHENLRMALMTKGISGSRPALKWESKIDRL